MGTTDTVLLIILFIILFIILCYNILYYAGYSDYAAQVDLTEHMIGSNNTNCSKRKWVRSKTCSSYMNRTTYDVLAANNIQKTDNPDEADIVFPCGYNNIDHEIKLLPHIDDRSNMKSNMRNKKPKIVFIIDGADEITAKNYLWLNILNYHGYNKARTLSPNTYVLTSDHKVADLARLVTEHKPGKLYIMKKNIQRQSGLLITDKVDDIISNKGSYVLAQEMLMDSYLVNMHKINLRVYVVVVCYKNRTTVYVYNNGFMYYTPKEFTPNPNNTSTDNHITTGYVDRDMYTVNPLTHVDFARYLDSAEGSTYHTKSKPRTLSDVEKSIRHSGQRISEVVFRRINELIRDVFSSFKGKIGRSDDSNGKPIPIYNDISVQIFGADVAIDLNLMPKIIEVNKGPDLDPKDERDSEVKKRLVDSIIRTGLTYTDEHNHYASRDINNEYGDAALIPVLEYTT